MTIEQTISQAGRATDSAAPWTPSVVGEIAEVISNDCVNAEYRHLVVRCGAVSASAQPGQFFQLLCPHSDGAQPFLRRPMSLYGADPVRGEVEFLYKIAGAGTRGLATLGAGDSVDIMGPLGAGFTLDPSLRHIVAIGRGAGLATLAPLAKAAKANGTRVTAIFSARRPELVLSVDLFTGQGADVIAVTDSEGTSGPAHIERILRGLIAENRCQAFYTCGSSRLLRVQQRLAREFEIPGQVAMEQQMACGIGLCFCCVRDFNVGGEIVSRRVCWDGPVFDMMEALP
ncbi:MAG: dihydroorotate dehydrogenase electron transfer subunit [Tardiphaga sp.]|jgi:dihydroorotate dehydrogenase electron transfer subunit|nr:dihydroorotate dehydrogenase electron transfer subunit [Tardiphaga sp.]